MTLEDNMKCINDDKEPTLVGIIEKPEDINWVNNIVQGLNQDLKDSGFDQYNFSVKKEGQKLYIEKD
tara:strand:+ start:173 stop:373 length:201 start_codon:yes stop_codon:yes gene_type:complete